ncbi:MAG TPA: alkaline phosphatase family protein, partial [Dehalococcoidia bacterium]|nr:alkaline phosphatase family protein [Dehalococcoidia bacterium]
GVPEHLLRRLADEGVMPRVAERIAGAHLRPMRASLPEISSVSWSSFMTGADPGEHGIYGFTDIEPQSYALTFPSFADVTVPTLWDRLGRRGVTSVVLNQPATYPARSIPGVMVSGFVAVDLSRSVKPLRWLGPLRRMNYRIDIDTARSRQDHDWLMRDLRQTLQTRREAVMTLWEEVDWRFFQVVVTGTDRLYHYLWDALEDSRHPRHQEALDYHHDVDTLVGEIWDRFAAEETDPQSCFWMLSDHGFCAIRQEVQLNAALKELGYLTLDEESPSDLTSLTPTSRAFALDPGRIYLNRTGRFGRGSVAESDAATLRTEIADALKQLRYDGQRVVRDVFDAADIYDEGPCFARGPDLVALAFPGFDLKASPAASEVFGRSDLVGMHTYDDAFLLTPRPIEGDLWIGEIAAHLEREYDE